MKIAERLYRVRAVGEAATSDPQERTRLWWEAMPMTYADSLNRTPQIEAEVRKYMTDFRTCCAHIASFPFDQLAGKKVLEIGNGFGAASCLFCAERS